MTALLDNRGFVSFLLACGVGLWAFFHYPFPATNTILHLIQLQKPSIYHGFVWTYIAMLFSTPGFAMWMLLSLVYTHAGKRQRAKHIHKLPPYPDPATRESLYTVMGEIHHPKRREPAEDPTWRIIPERGLYCGTAIVGAIGSGKTSCCMYPYADQILGYRARDKEKKAAALVLEVKGDFCHQVQTILEKHGRSGDYLEVSLTSDFRYNPLHNNRDAEALAYGIAALATNVFGKGKDPFWQQAYTDVTTFLILLYRTLYGYVTLLDLYRCAINPQLLDQRMQEGEDLLSLKFIVITPDVYVANAQLETFRWEPMAGTRDLRAVRTDELVHLLNRAGIEYDTLSETPREADQTDRQQVFTAIRHSMTFWKSLDPKLRTSIIEGMKVLLSPFDSNVQLKRTFCPPKELYDDVANGDCHLGIPMPPMPELIEQGKVIALNFPVASNPNMARLAGTLLKMDFQYAMLSRIPLITEFPQRHFRPVLFLCDEYHAFATVGESDPSGDEKFFALSRQSRCIPIVATQSISSLRSALPGDHSWETLMQTFRTKIFLALADPFSAEYAAKLCGKELTIRRHYSSSEGSHDAKISMLTGRSAAERASITISKSFNEQVDNVFEPKVFTELRNAEAVILAYDGIDPHPPSLCYLKPFYLDPNMSYFEQFKAGLL